MTTFTDLGLAEGFAKALAALGYAAPTPIQTQAIPSALAGRDVLGLAQTGTGKTAAFALPILQRLLANRKKPTPRACRVLVLAPTRELAAQICEGFVQYGARTGLIATTAFGGVPIGRQMRALSGGVDVLVATPGRLLDLMGQRAVTLSGVEALVLDEADHMLDLGFIVPLRKILHHVPKARQTLLFSATMPKEIQGLADEFLTDPVRVEVTPVASTPERVAQSVIHVPMAKKQDLLHVVLEDSSISRALVFTRTKHGADRVVKKLEAAGIAAEAIHGNKSQGQRERALVNFKTGRTRLLVATDIAARGIDVDLVSHVIQFDLPDTPEAYVHRIGRTARAGATGEAIAFCAPEERGLLRDIERLTKLKVPAAGAIDGLSLPEPSETKPAPRPQTRNGRSRSSHPQQQKPQQKPRRDRGEGARPGADAPRSERPARREEEAGGGNVWSNYERPQGRHGRGPRRGGQPKPARQS
jgi:ATP-dependent RNA helicase RhlE